MNLRRIAFILPLVVLYCAAAGFAQTKTKPTPAGGLNPIKASPAYAEVLLKKTELAAELEGLLVEYTEEFPKVKELRYESGLLQKELDRLLTVSAADASKLSAALGKMMVRKCELDTDLWSLLLQLNAEHPDVKRAKRKSEMFAAAINEILQNK